VLGLSLAFGASVAWGSADFLAGVGCRRLPLLTVLLVSQAVGLALFVPPALLLGGPPPALSFALLGMLAGLFNALALAALYRGLAGGLMGVVAPIAATDAVIPVAFGVLQGERPDLLVTLGIGIALAGVIVASLPAIDEGPAAASRDPSRRSVAFGLAAAVCFGCFVVALAGASEGSTVWAVAYSRITSVVLLGAAALALRPSMELGSRDATPLLAIGGLDVGASAMFAVATTTGLLSVVGVLGSLYPVFTILLAAAVLRERPATLQRMGAVGALLGAGLIAAG
jgi:drug/metabolite transporter (DMT)-like permease